MAWAVQKVSGMFLICQRIPVRFDACAETRFPFLRICLLVGQIRQGMWRASQNSRGFFSAFAIKKGTDHLTLWVRVQLNYHEHLGPVEVRLRELLHKSQMRTPWLQFGVIKAEVLGC